MKASRPSWLPPESTLRRILAPSARSYPYYRLQLAEYVCRLLPAEGQCSVLDVGAGEGALDAVIQRFRPQSKVVGVETFIRANRSTVTPGIRIDGLTLPFADRAFDVSMLLNVLHHAQNPRQLLREVYRVTRCSVIIKDHLANHALDHYLLALLDVLGNIATGAVIHGNYLSDVEWTEILQECANADVVRYEQLSFRRGLLKRLFGNHLEIIFELKRA